MKELLEHWVSYTFSPTIKVPNNATNFVESFNARIEKFKHKPMMSLLEHRRKTFMSTITKRFNAHQEWPSKVCPRIRMKLEIDSRQCIVTPTGRG